MEESVARLVTALALIIGLSVTYAKTFAPYQTGLTQIVIDATALPSRYKPLLNLGIGILLASVITVVGAYITGETVVIAAGIVAGIFGSIEAQRVYDAERATTNG